MAPAVQFQFRHYSRVFRQALFTPLGVWSSRLGMIVRLQQGDRVAYGEIAPIPWFAGESFDGVFQFCGRWLRQWPDGVTAEAIAAIPDTLPATRFGLGWAWEQLQRSPEPDPAVPFWPDQAHLDRGPDLPQAALLPLNSAGLGAWEALWEQGYRTFKLKVGDRPLAQDLELVQSLCQALPGEAKLRLDANGKLEEAGARRLLEVCDRLGQIEFVEQPIAARLFADISLGPLEPEAAAALASYDPWPLLQALAQEYQTPIAVDESVTTVEQVRAAYDRGWRGVFVLKPSLAGSPQAVRDLLGLPELDLVFSSAFESAIGRQAVLTLAAEWAGQHSGQQRAAGLGVSQFLQQDGLDSATADEVWRFIQF
ncbi:MAG: o-succinylbenzoate synthase [Prochlorothrix sp.]|nr:o-succinylbenzoate synthase [Prochlorothrix sp.]